MASLKYTLMRSSWRSESPWYDPVGSTPCSSEMTYCVGAWVSGLVGLCQGRGGDGVQADRLTHLPELGADLVAALAALHVHDLTHGCCWLVVWR